MRIFHTIGCLFDFFSIISFFDKEQNLKGSYNGMSDFSRGWRYVSCPDPSTMLSNISYQPLLTSVISFVKVQVRWLTLRTNFPGQKPEMRSLKPVPGSTGSPITATGTVGLKILNKEHAKSISSKTSKIDIYGQEKRCMSVFKEVSTIFGEALRSYL
jgi:hypothetical protein